MMSPSLNFLPQTPQWSNLACLLSCHTSLKKTVAFTFSLEIVRLSSRLCSLRWNVSGCSRLSHRRNLDYNPPRFLPNYTVSPTVSFLRKPLSHVFLSIFPASLTLPSTLLPRYSSLLRFVWVKTSTSSIRLDIQNLYGLYDKRDKKSKTSYLVLYDLYLFTIFLMNFLISPPQVIIWYIMKINFISRAMFSWIQS